MPKDKKNHKGGRNGNDTPAAVGGEQGEKPDLKRKDYESKLRELHVELVHLQEWVRHEAKKICIVFEGRDGAGKGGAIKAITARLSPRVFRVVALPAPTEREKSQMYVQRYLPHLPAGGEVVIFDRSWYNRAGVERVMGFCTDEEAKRFLSVAPQVEKTIVELGNHLAQVLARGQPGRAGNAAKSPDRRRAQDLEALQDGSEVFRTLGRLHPGTR